jgi:diguanylate cyclase (GGDEF)-like protein
MMDWYLQSGIEGSEILVVDDNIVNLKVLCKVLENKGFKVRSAQDGAGTLKTVSENTPDLILLDIQMPDMSGFDVCKRLKENKNSQDIPIIFITASDEVEKKIEGFDLGAVDFISRPLQMPEVLARVRNHLTLRNLQRTADEEKTRLKRILAALPLPYLISRVSDSKILEMNAKACSALDVSYDDLHKYRSTDFYANPEVRPQLIEMVQRNGLVSNEEITLLTRSGKEFTTLFSATPLQLMGEDVFFVTFTDISERKEMELALEKAATTDYLTGTLNRRAFTERASAERYRANRNKKPVSLLMIDIDHFKKINDTYGHDVGDDALKELVRVIAANLREYDAFGRLGGEEFALLLPETDIEGAKVLAERVRLAIQDNEMVMSDGRGLTMTVSGGLSAWKPDVTFDEVLKLADMALYEAKNGGRNQIRLAGD